MTFEWDAGISDQLTCEKLAASQILILFATIVCFVDVIAKNALRTQRSISPAVDNCPCSASALRCFLAFFIPGTFEMNVSPPQNIQKSRAVEPKLKLQIRFRSSKFYPDRVNQKGFQAFLSLVCLNYPSNADSVCTSGMTYSFVE